MGNCVEVGLQPGSPVVLRNSTVRGGPELLFTGVEWVAFLQGVKNNEFELPDHA